MAKKLFKKFTWKKLLAVLLAIITFAGTIFGLVKLSEKMKDDKTKASSVFEVGGLDASTGKYVDTDTSIYTKNSFKAKGLEIKLDFDSNITYQVYFYDELGEFVSCSEVYDKGHKFYTPAYHEVRILVTPVWDLKSTEDEQVIKWYNVHKYSSQLEIRVDKNQNFTESDFTHYNLNAVMWAVEEGMYVGADGTLAGNDRADTYYIQNEGEFSLFYLKSFEMEYPEIAIMLRLVDGTIVNCFTSNANLPGYTGVENPTPTLENPCFFPKGATLYVTGQFGEANLDNTILGFY